MTEQTTEKTVKLAGVRFRDNWKVYDFDAGDLEIAVGDRVIVASERGQGFATVVRIRTVPEAEVVKTQPPPPVPEGVEIDLEDAEKAAATAGAPARSVKRILRKADEADLAREAKNRERESEAFVLAQETIAERELPMKLIRVEYSFDGSRITFYFFSETRVDFRELVKDLAFRLKSRIEMRQIGVRDVARLIGGFGPCGRELCCTSFLKNFEPVSIRMAKRQEMVLNPAKISGVCGRLLCCLSYEYEMYDAIKKDLAEMRESALREKQQAEEQRIAEERKEAEERRKAEEQRRQEERRRQEPRRQEQRRGGQEKKQEQQERKPQPPQQQQQRKQQRQQQKQQKQQPKPEKPQETEQKAPQPQQEGEKSAAKKRRRRFWRNKKKGGGQQGPERS